MPDHRLVCLLCLLLLLGAVSSSSARQQPQGDPDEDADEEATLEAAPEPPRQVMKIEVKENRLNVEIENADFGSVIRSIADRAKFRIEGSAGSFGRKLTTKFSDVEIERGISRLFSLAKESNYFLHYNTDGTISKLQIFPAGAGTSAVPGPRQPSGGMQTPPPPPATVAPPRTQTVPARPSAPPPRTVRPQVFPDDDDDDDEDEVQAVPYVAPPPRQPLFPPKRN
jgi:hypothetical protein